MEAYLLLEKKSFTLNSEQNVKIWMHSLSLGDLSIRFHSEKQLSHF